MSDRKKLTINNRSWHGRMYLMWRDRYSHFKAPYKRRSWDYQIKDSIPAYRENLCHYVRVVLFWGPVNWFFRGKVMARNTYDRPDTDTFKEFLRQAPIAGYLFVLFLVSAYGLSWIVNPTATLLSTVVVVGVISLGIGIGFVGSNWKDIKQWWRSKRNKNEPLVPEEDKEPTIVHVIYDFAKAKKQRVCPLIDIDEGS